MKKLAAFVVFLAGFLFAGCSLESTPATDSSSVVVVVDDANFQAVVLESDKPVLVDFWASWCGPCKMIAPVVEEIALDFEGRAVVAKLDVDVAGQIAESYNVSHIPTLIVFQNGEEMSRIVGIASEAELTDKLYSALAR